ncbi:hypothetical protein PILCRDRAFT_675957 [Piloderma croceum F 1598]|uniref:Uncharacterized protein n=1 Tax=Piloderma croceum (strain F 1598) TaxID=765440 RepID=A0A0C3ES15_PILCF|nr:hypothetical protein PILCRDRAFT_675957 [Piloderma croceum F 1598]
MSCPKALPACFALWNIRLGHCVLVRVRLASNGQSITARGLFDQGWRDLETKGCHVNCRHCGVPNKLENSQRNTRAFIDPKPALFFNRTWILTNDCAPAKFYSDEALDLCPPDASHGFPRLIVSPENLSQDLDLMDLHLPDVVVTHLYEWNPEALRNFLDLRRGKFEYTLAAYRTFGSENSSECKNCEHALS